MKEIMSITFVMNKQFHM